MTADEKHRSGLNTEDYHKLTGFEGDWRDSWWDDDYLAFMGGKWNLAEVRKALDVGSGVGHWGQRLLKHMSPEASMQGVDAEAAWESKAATRAEKLGLKNQTSYQTAPAEALPFEDNSFDFVTCQTLLMHVRDAGIVVAEMIRVLRPGGLFVAAEPNNFGSAAGHLINEPRIPWENMVELLELDYFCAQGKEALGEGWSSMGNRLPQIVAEQGLVDLRVNVNNKCAYKVPPYDNPEAQSDIKMLRDGHEAGAIMAAGGTFENGQRMFLAGGGTKARFEHLWNQARAHDARNLAAFDENRYASAGGYLHHLVWGRKAS